MSTRGRPACRLAACSMLTVTLPPAMARGQHEFTWREVHMGMEVRITGHAPNDSVARAAGRAAFAEIARLEDVFSDWRAESELSRLSAVAGALVPVSRDLFDVLSVALRVARVSGGAFDPTVGPLVALWREGRRTGSVPSVEALAAARALVGWTLVSLDSARQAVALARPGMRLDLGGVAKGYILGRARLALARHGVKSCLVEAGGDLVVGAAPPGRTGWSVAVHAAETEELLRKAVSMEDMAVATSGPSAQYLDAAGQRFSHVIDPRTGLGLQAGVQATVIGDDPALVDAVATALTVLPAEDRVPFLRAFPGLTGSISWPR